MSEDTPEGTDSSVEQISITLQGLTIAATTSRSGGSARTQISIDGSSQSTDPLHGPSRAETSATSSSPAPTRAVRRPPAIPATPVVPDTVVALAGRLRSRGGGCSSPIERIRRAFYAGWTAQRKLSAGQGYGREISDTGLPVRVWGAIRDRHGADCRSVCRTRAALDAVIGSPEADCSVWSAFPSEAELAAWFIGSGRESPFDR